jgi:hypothetical protein
VEPLLPSVVDGVLPSRRDLLLQALVHLPRLANAAGNMSRRQALAEIERQRKLRHEELLPFAHLAKPPLSAPALDQLEVVRIEANLARPILEQFHYLRSFRPDGITIAATYRARVVALAMIAPLDVPAIAAELPLAGAHEAALISRVFAFDWAPRNTISYLLARLERRTELRDARLLLTYVNTNLGFSGASYRAANWRVVGYERGTRYAYLDGRYITDRRLLTLPPEESACVEFSRMPLEPLALYASFRDRHLEPLQRRPFFVNRA